MKKLLVHLHLYYPEIYKELESCILNLAPKYDFDLFVTIPETNLNLKPQILSSFPNAKVQVVENIGYDIYPFIKVIQGVNLDDYSYVIKLHTKRNINKLKYDYVSIYKNKWFGESNWREGLITFIKSKENLNKVISFLNEHDQVGMHGDHAYILNQFTDAQKTIKPVQNYLKQKSYKFVSGSMFIAKAQVFKLLQNQLIDATNFEKSDQTHELVQFAHIMERYLGYCVTSNNLKIADCLMPKLNKFLITARKCLDLFLNTFVISFRQTKKNKLLIKVFKIPVYNRTIKNNKE